MRTKKGFAAKRMALIREASTVAADGDAWRERMERWLDLHEEPESGEVKDPIDAEFLRGFALLNRMLLDYDK